MGRKKKETGLTVRASAGDANYTTKAFSEFTIMTNEELKNWEAIQKYIKAKGARLW